MLLALIAEFALSQAFRTVTAIIATGLQGEFGLSPQALGLFAGAFAFAFGGMQMFMGIGIGSPGQFGRKRVSTVSRVPSSKASMPAVVTGILTIMFCASALNSTACSIRAGVSR